MTEPITLAQRQFGGLMAQLCGDAAGLSYETLSPDELPELPDDLFTLPPPPFVRQHPGTPFPSWSDDGARALCLAESVRTHRGAFLAQDFGERLLRWFDGGHMAVGGYVFGTGGTTRAALARIRAGVPALEAGLTEETALGNGGLMGALPLPLWFKGSDQELILAAADQCQVTHAHPRAIATVVAFCLWARDTLHVDHDRDPLEVARGSVARLRRLCRRPEVATRVAAAEVEMLGDLLDGKLGRPTGGFYVVDTFHSAVMSQRATVSETIRAAVLLGHDTDTTAAVAAGIAGVRFGIEAVPLSWRDALLAVAPPEAKALLSPP